MNSPKRSLWLLFGGMAVALGASLWALAGTEACSACLRSASLAGDLNLAAVGTGFYLLLLVAGGIWAIRNKERLGEARVPWLLASGVLAATGVHVMLLGLLLKNRILCPACLVTAAGALVAFGALLAGDRANLRRAMIVVPLMAAVTFGGTRFLRGRSQSDFLRQGKIAAYTVFEEKRAVPRGQAVLVVYVRPTCHVCSEFKQQVLAALGKEFPGQVTIEERRAWKGLATPTTVVLGNRNSLFIGYEDVAGLRQAVRIACGATSAALPTTAIRLP
ncbi:MAG: hypothetical protein K0Q72_1012 [Armatimonadetes bacterium]|jgi:hypothetical protein|nr:hypothetical protein [Armatimonadota bacterium]